MSKHEKGTHRPGREEPTAAVPAHPAPTAAGSAGATADPVETAGHLDKVRDILFGAHLREAEQQMQRLEARLLKVLSELRDETRRRQEAQDALIKQEIEALNERLRSERELRDDAVQGVVNELREATAASQKRHAQTDEQLGRAQRELRQQIAAQSNAWTEELRRRSNDLEWSTAQSVSLLREEKTDKRALVALFGELAIRLNGDPSGSGS